MQSLTLVLGTPEYTLEQLSYDRIEKTNKVRIYINENEYEGIEPDVTLDTYLTNIMKFKHDKNGYYYHANAMSMLYSYEPIYDPHLFYSNNLERYIFSIYLHDMNWEKTLEKIKDLQFSIVYRRERHWWVARSKKSLARDPPRVLGEANHIVLKEILNYSDLHVIHTIGFYNVEWL